MSEEQWELIANYVQSVAAKAYRYGHLDGEDSGVVSVNERTAAAQRYVATGFDVETVKAFHPAARSVSLSENG